MFFHAAGCNAPDSKRPTALNSYRGYRHANKRALKNRGSVMVGEELASVRRRSERGLQRAPLIIAVLLAGLTAIPSSSLSEKRPYFHSAEFSRDGKLLGMIGGSWIYLWDLAG
ncbi:MAG: hypothetical protein LAP13_05715 [Acidobacteriia bacterium]|nr:hypothetical protein [Terriglobia bacterium]